jgi:hypothetical protein
MVKPDAEATNRRRVGNTPLSHPESGITTISAIR